MPDDRLLSPRAGRSNKIAKLTYRESWVWMSYILAADDFGVMPFDAYAVQSIDKRLRLESTEHVHEDLTTLVHVGLVLQFTDQDGLFICDPIWQDFQKVRWPKVKTTMPCPPIGILKQCCKHTAELLRNHRRFPKNYRISQSSNASCLQAKGLGLKANGLGLTGESEGEHRKDGDLRTFFALYYELFQAKFGVKPQIEGGKDGAIASGILKKYGLDQTSALLRAFFGSLDPFIQKSGYTIGVFRSQVNRLLVDLSGVAGPHVSERTQRLMASTKEFLR